LGSTWWEATPAVLATSSQVRELLVSPQEPFILELMARKKRGKMHGFIKSFIAEGNGISPKVKAL